MTKMHVKRTNLHINDTNWFVYVILLLGGRKHEKNKEIIIITDDFMYGCAPVMALEGENMNVLELFKEDLVLFYEGRSFVFEDEEGNDIADEILSYKEQFYQNQDYIAQILLNRVSSYGEITNMITTYSTKSRSYTWKDYRIKVTNSVLIIADIKVSASYDTTTKKIKSPTGIITVKQKIGNTKMKSYKVTISYLNSGKTVRYNFNVIVLNGLQQKTIKLTKDWTPKF